jgi:hypothetical protein
MAEGVVVKHAHHVVTADIKPAQSSVVVVCSTLALRSNEISQDE